MPLSSRDIEDIGCGPFKEPWFTKCFGGMLRLLLKIPPFKRYLLETAGGLSGSIFRCWKQKEFQEATEIAIHALQKFRNKKSKILPMMDHHHWWSFMKLGVDSANNIENEELEEKLITLATTGIEPIEGYNVAYSFLEFSRWKYRAEKYEEAVKYAKVASQADGTWTEPDFLLGWYGLLLGTGNAVEHLSRAIEKDHRVLFRVVNNDVCKQYPHIVNKLKEKYLVLERS